MLETHHLLTLLAYAITASAHGHISNVVINGVSYPGYDSPAWYGNPNAPNVFGWTISQQDNGFVSPDAFGSSDIICHREAVPAKSHVQVAAGDILTLQWTPWPDSHHGPVIDYLANCNGPCESVDKTTLEFFKIDGVGIISQGSPGTYADDVLISKNNTWEVKIPANIAPGNYVLRHEIIALHSAGSENGAQAYPQCFNLKITGSGSLKPAGVKGTALYKATDPGILVNIYTSSVNYIVPGPTLVAGLPSSVAQNPSQITASATATPGDQTGPGTPTTTLATSVKTSSGSSGGLQTVYGQCGGQSWTGPTACVGGAKCATQNAYYAQCTPA
ncbi:glycoside hydrolase family 61 [Pochonia chlamydosporia 170]|uniref:lytic cellulose monooxygenase (C4-dehydrogenating) n=1 Tax=Pochonia chlamydosporia 170 TaxID=1380566 RepID=A0A179FID2_METCM|nr:glycoside hydrolase family 61 [Pochonia chlamydosporia 170]OAQ64763.1 glycoside hydrolase family 61 [Pochonia chlamydosporia 170]